MGDQERHTDLFHLTIERDLIGIIRNSSRSSMPNTHSTWSQ
jgi:predicted transcriptional regulator